MCIEREASRVAHLAIYESEVLSATRPPTSFFRFDVFRIGFLVEELIASLSLDPVFFLEFLK